MSLRRFRPHYAGEIWKQRFHSENAWNVLRPQYVGEIWKDINISPVFFFFFVVFLFEEKSGREITWLSCCHILFEKLCFQFQFFSPHLSPDQTESQVDASWKLGSTCGSVWPGLACTCVDLRWLALTLVEIKFARKSRQVFHRLATQPKSTKVEWRPLT